MQMDRYGEPRPDFAAWLLLQRDRGDWVDQIADGARRDRGFPRHGSVDDVRAYFAKMQVDGDVHAAIDDAEVDHHAY